MDNFNDWTLYGLNDEQRRACVSENNIILTSCPGSGKTRTIVHRLAYLVEKYPNSRKINLAITYTNKAADEIKNRLENMQVDDVKDWLGKKQIDTSKVWAGTIHQFCLTYIIKPYAMYSENLRYGYHIIDDYIDKQYKKDAISSILNKNIKYIYDEALDEYIEKNVEVKNYYISLLKQQKALSFDGILKESLALLQLHTFIAENISNVIRSIHVDEYQDTREIQYQILAKIFSVNKEINIFFVGDVSQSIYTTLGGIVKDKKELEKLFGSTFEELSLNGCYRSTQKIINYYSYFLIRPLVIHSLSNASCSHSLIQYDRKSNRSTLVTKIGELVKRELLSGVPANEICIAAPQNYLLFNMAKELRKILPEVDFDAPEISPFKYNPLDPFYILAWLIFTRPGYRTD